MMSKEKQTIKLNIPVPSLSIRKSVPFLSVLLIGIIIGVTAAHGYFSFKRQDVGQYQDDAAAYIKFKQIKSDFMPAGAPKIYGQELDISFDAVQDAINKAALFDPTYGADGKKIALTDFTAEELGRYKKIGSSIACEYCCGVKTLTQEDGTAACGCAHSAMMRGLAAYLIKKHPQEFSDEQILNELTMWKRTYFPKETLSTELDKLAKAGEPGVEQILKEFPDFLPQMVGGC